MAKIRSNKNSTKKDVIVAKASSLFLQKGYAATSMRDLAEHVGVEAASLYNHIRSKAELLQDICFKVANQFMTHIEQVDSSDRPAIAKVEAIIQFHIRQMIDNYEDVYVMEREWKHLTDPYLSNFQTQRRVYRQRFASIIQEGIRKGEIREIDAPTAVLIMLHAISGIESWHRSKKRISGDQLEKNMVTILINGLKN